MAFAVLFRREFPRDRNLGCNNLPTDLPPVFQCETKFDVTKVARLTYLISQRKRNVVFLIAIARELKLVRSKSVGELIARA